jgi:hypothetical protein
MSLGKAVIQRTVSLVICFHFTTCFCISQVSYTIRRRKPNKCFMGHFMGLLDDPELQPVLFGLFLSMYLITVLGNLLIILAVSSDSHLYTPMYFFLSNLSLADISSISTTIPR